MRLYTVVDNKDISLHNGVFMKLQCIVLGLLCSIAFVPLHVFALGISVIPSEVVIQTRLYQPTYKTLIIKNPSQESAIFDFFVDDFEDMMRARPKNVVLESNEEKRIRLEILPNREGVFTTDVSIVARSLSSQSFKPGAGLKVPITITVGPETKTPFTWGWIFIVGDFLLIICFIVGVWWMWKRKSFNTKLK